MRVWRTLMLVLPAIVVVVVALVVPGRASAQAVDCGSILGPGGTYVLDRDLTCPETPPPSPDREDRIGAIKLIDGATLDLNGHTVTCSSPTILLNGAPSTTPTYGIVVRDSTLRNGTVHDCGHGLVASGSVVKHVVFDGNVTGVYLHEKYGSGNNMIIGNTVRNNRVGFFVQESRGEHLIDNLAENNQYGFMVNWRGGILVGNKAVGNDTGFWIDTGEALIGNRAIRNRVGFYIASATEMFGNIAKNNTEDGFFFQTSLKTLDEARHNFAHRNGQDGFRLDVTGGAEPDGTLKKNYALANRGVGIHVLSEGDFPSAPRKKVKRNISLDNLGGDMADDGNCQWTNWVNNTFETAAQSCID